MKLDLVTMTGADDSTDPKDLYNLSEKYPFVEWGILISKNWTGKTSRYPSEKWIEEAKEIFDMSPVKLSCHICGSWVRDLLIGDPVVLHKFPYLTNMFKRFQLNFHAEKVEWDKDKFISTISLFPTKEFLFQIDGENGNKIFDEILKEKKHGVKPLFDISGGRGILPDEWPGFISEAKYCGYAGGLGPENLEEQLKKINSTVGENDRVWIDMETRVRSNNDTLFDLNKVEDCLKIAQKYIN